MDEKFFDEFDPLTGTRTQIGFVDDKMVTHTTGDLEPLVDNCKRLANDDDYSRQGIKKGWWHVCDISPVVQVELLKIGIDVMRAPAREIIAGLKRLHYDHLLTTRGNV